LVALGEISEDFEEVLVSLEELIEYLDNSEEQIDV
jgi:exonuclease VII small subunit